MADKIDVSKIDGDLNGKKSCKVCSKNAVSAIMSCSNCSSVSHISCAKAKFCVNLANSTYKCCSGESTEGEGSNLVSEPNDNWMEDNFNRVSENVFSKILTSPDKDIEKLDLDNTDLLKMILLENRDSRRVLIALAIILKDKEKEKVDLDLLRSQNQSLIDEVNTLKFKVDLMENTLSSANICPCLRSGTQHNKVKDHILPPGNDSAVNTNSPLNIDCNRTSLTLNCDDGTPDPDLIGKSKTDTHTDTEETFGLPSDKQQLAGAEATDYEEGSVPGSKHKQQKRKMLYSGITKRNVIVGTAKDGDSLSLKAGQSDFWFFLGKLQKGTTEEEFYLPLLYLTSLQ